MQRGSVLPLFLIIGLIIAIGIGVFFNQSFKTSTTSEAAVPIKSSKQVAPSLETQIVESEISGLSFEIPMGFSLKKETEEEYFKRAFGNIRKNFAYYVLYQPAEFAEAFYVNSDSEKNLDKAILTVWVFKNPEDLDAQKFYKNNWYYPFVWGDFSGGKEKIAPVDIELIGGKEGKSGVVDFRDDKPKFIYLPLPSKKLMLQIQFPTENNLVAKKILESFKFE